jgi:NAD+ kinase
MSAVTASQDAIAPAAEPAPAIELRRLGLVVHPQREIGTALDVARAWADANGAELVQIRVSGQERVVADPGEVASCDIVLGVGGDGTTLHALHAAASVGRPVLGVACGSLGALTAVAAEDLDEALDAVAAGGWLARRLPGLRIAGDGIERIAINDLVVVRRGASQVVVEIHVDDQVYVRYAGDGIVVATPAGSSAYTLAAGGPILAERSDGLVLTPLAPHGGCCPPLVVGAGSAVKLVIEPGYAGARLEFDGQAEEAEPAELRAERVEEYATLVGLGDSEPLLAGLRRRRILIDSPRVLARDDRAKLKRDNPTDVV